MFDLVKKAMFTGIGVMSLTKDKIEDVAKEFVEKGKLSEQEGKKLVDEILERSEESKNEISKQIDAVVKTTMAKMDVATKTDVANLQKEIEELKAKLDKE